MIGENVGKKLNKYVEDYVVFDLETTGVSIKTDEVIEISAIKVSGGRVADEFSTLVNPLRPIPYQASRVNGITDSMVKNSPDFKAALGAFLDFTGNQVLVGHNIHTFDLKFIRRDAMNFWNMGIANDYVDTLPLARACLPKLKSYSLTNLASHYGIRVSDAHRALGDCRMNQQVFEHLGREIKNPAPEAGTAFTCPQCGQLMQRRKGRFGEFWGCTGFPDCRYTQNV
ncbi:DNA polymerase-3 subunit epsilon [Lachnospiraceae bacterium PF1-22]|uniref:3'-5' exonuclease n=1 Tax=Ohessyouella blattaphilus TaxID=2949333 RepID=UPI003E23A31B